MMSASTAGASPIIFKQDSTLVVLKYLVLGHTITLCIQKLPGPEDKGHNVIYSNQFFFSQAFCIQLLAGGGQIN
jgi:hypothetical protein